MSDQRPKRDQKYKLLASLEDQPRETLTSYARIYYTSFSIYLASESNIQHLLHTLDAFQFTVTMHRLLHTIQKSPKKSHLDFLAKNNISPILNFRAILFMF